MRQLHEVRQLYGGVYVTIFSEDLIVPWMPLTIGEYIQYHHDNVNQRSIQCLLEDEIFKKCVVDETLVRQISFLPAGIISTVVQNIWQFSGPINIDTFNDDLEMARQIVYGSDTKSINQIVQMITSAFPYKPEEVYAMNYETMLQRAAMAEAKLIELGLVVEPIRFIAEHPEQTEETPKAVVDAKKLWEEYQARQGIQPPGQQKVSEKRAQTPSRSLPVPSKKTERWWKVSPILEHQNIDASDLAAQEPIYRKRKLDFNHETKEAELLSLDNHDRLESPEMQQHLLKLKHQSGRDQMIQDAQVMYADVIKALEEQRKLVAK